MKSARLKEIIRIVTEYDISTQDELIMRLKDAGFDVTQATVSRDIKELRLAKITGPDGNQRYAPPKAEHEFSDRVRMIFNQSVVSVATAGNLVVLKCLTGMGNAACEALDSMQFGHIVGTIAGDNTIFAAVDNPEVAKQLARELTQLL